MIIERGDYPSFYDQNYHARTVPNIPRGNNYKDTLVRIHEALKNDIPLDEKINIANSTSKDTLRGLCVRLHPIRLVEKTRYGYTTTEAFDKWYDSNNDEYLAAILAAKCVFFSGMLDSLREPQTSASLLNIANSDYGVGWKKKSGVQERLLWAKDLGLVDYHDYEDHKWFLTARGLELLGDIDVEPKETNDDLELSEVAIFNSPSQWAMELVKKAKNNKRDSIGYIAGEKNQYSFTIQEFLAFISNNPEDQSIEQFAYEMLEIKKSSTNSMLNTLSHLGFIKRNGERSYAVTPLGYTWMDDPTDINLACCFDSKNNCLFPILALVSADDQTLDDIMEQIQRFYSASQFKRDGINKRIHILVNAGLIKKSGYLTFSITDAGKELMSQLEIHLPELTVDLAVEDAVGSEDSADTLIVELKNSASDIKHFEIFEKAVASAFDCLGFHTQSIGKSGNTDVLATANAADKYAYRIAIDAKTTTNDSVKHNLVDFDTLDSHKKKHEADYVAVVGIQFSEKRIIDRAKDHGVVLIGLSELVQLLKTQSDTPLTSQDLRPLFENPGLIDLSLIEDTINQVYRNGRLLKYIMDALLKEGSDKYTRGILDANTMYIILRDKKGLDNLDPTEVSEMLSFMASPLIGCISREGNGYYAITSLEDAARKFGYYARSCSERI